MSEIAGIVGKRIRLYRESFDLSREKLAELADKHPSYIGQLERGEKNATLETIYDISSALNVPIERFVENISIPPQDNNFPWQCYNLILDQSPVKQKKLFTILQEVIRLDEKK